jgi:hypothetical protein
MAVVDTNRRRVTTLGRGSTTTEIHTSGSSSSNVGAHTVTRTEERPQVIATEAVASPEIAATKKTPVHVGLGFSFTLKWHGND